MRPDADLSLLVKERGAASTEMAILVAVLLGIAVFIGTAMVNKNETVAGQIESTPVDVPIPN